MRVDRKRLKTLEDAGFEPAASAPHRGALEFAVRVGAKVRWCRRARRRPDRLRTRDDVDAAAADEKKAPPAKEKEKRRGADEDENETRVAKEDDGPRGSSRRRATRLGTHVWHAKRFEMRERWGWTLPERRVGAGRGWRWTLASARDAAVAHDASYHVAHVLEEVEYSEEYASSLVPGEEGTNASGEKAATERSSNGSPSGGVDAALAAAFPEYANFLASTKSPFAPKRGFFDESESESASRRRAWAFDASLVRPSDGAFVAPATVVRASRRLAVVWTHPAAAEAARGALDAAARERRGGAATAVRSARGDVARLEIVGAKSRAVVDALVRGGEVGKEEGGGVLADGERERSLRALRSPSLVGAASRVALRPARRRWVAQFGARGEDASGAGAAIADDHREAALEEGGLDFLARDAAARARSKPLSAETLGRRNAAARSNALLRRDGGALALDPPLPRCPLTIVRRTGGAAPSSPASEGFTLVAPREWAAPLLLALARLGARVAGGTEWRWLALRAGAPAFPFDFPDAVGAPSGEDDRRALETDPAPFARAPWVDRVLEAGRNSSAPDEYESARPAPPPREELRERARRSSTGSARRRPDVARWRPVAAKKAAGSTTSPSDRSERSTADQTRSLALTRVLVRCPRGGRPRVGAPVLAPAAALEDGEVHSDTRRHSQTQTQTLCRLRSAESVASREVVGVVTSASAPGAAVGLASALVDAARLAALPRRRGRGAYRGEGGAYLAELGVPGSTPPAVVPAEMVPARRDGYCDPAWW